MTRAQKEKRVLQQLESLMAFKNLSEDERKPLREQTLKTMDSIISSKEYATRNARKSFYDNGRLEASSSDEYQDMCSHFAVPNSF